jgi:RNA polymerase sigma-70 factor, ECF subfamily
MSAVAGTQRFPLIRAKAEALNDTRPENPDVAGRTRAMVRGDEAAWVEFHREYSGRVHRYLLVLLRGDVEVASEVLQATFTRIARHVREFNDETVLWHWVTRLARTAAIDELRKRGRREESLRELASEPPSGHAAEDEWPELLQQALTQMEAADRELLEQKYLEGQSVREIAATGGDSEKAVESKLTRARGKLRAALLQLLKREK